MNELYARGPIAVAINAMAPGFIDHTGPSVYCDSTGANTTTDHAVSVVGWGVYEGQDYWLVRNSWGTYWGDQGFIKVCKGVGNIAIESYASWATPVDTWTTPLMHTTTIAEQTNSSNDATVYEFPQPLGPTTPAPRIEEFLTKKSAKEEFPCRVPENYFTKEPPV